MVGVTFFVGSLFFTAAAHSQFLQVINPDGGTSPGRFRYAPYARDREALTARAHVDDLANDSVVISPACRA